MRRRRDYSQLTLRIQALLKNTKLWRRILNDYGPPGPVADAYRCLSDVCRVIVLRRMVPWSVRWMCLIGAVALVKLSLPGISCGRLGGWDGGAGLWYSQTAISVNISLVRRTLKDSSCQVIRYK